MSRDQDAILAVVSAFREIKHLHVDAEDAANVMHVGNFGHGLPDEAFLSDGKATNLTVVLSKALRLAPKDSDITSTARSLIKAKVRTFPFLEAVLMSGLNLSEKVDAIDLADGNIRELDIKESTLKVLENHMIRFLGNNLDSDSTNQVIQKVVGFANAVGKDEEYDVSGMILRVSASGDCSFAGTMAKALPDFFNAVQELVLKSGSTRALAHFWKTNSGKCDKKVFLEKMAEALRPDPVLMAEAILEGRGQGCHPFMGSMFHPMMMYEIGPWRR